MIIKKKAISFKFPNLILIKKIVISFLFLILVLIVLNLDFYKIKILKMNLSFSPSESFFENAIDVKIHSPIKNAEIYYTLDGSEPSANSFKYQNDQIIPIEKNTVIRAGIFKNKQKYTEPISKSYFISFDSSLPIISIITDPKNLWDEKIGIYVLGNNLEKANYSQRGDDWLRSANFTYFDKQQEIISRSIEFKIAGGASAYLPQKSLNLYFNNSTSNNAVNFNFFKQTKTTIFDSLRLRNSGNDWHSTLFRDCLMHELLRKYTNLDIQSCQPAVVFLNDQYWGIHNIRERYNKNYFIEKYSDYKLDSDKIIVSETYSGPNREGYPNIQIGKESDGDSYLKLINYVADNDLTYNVVFQSVKNKIDLENFIDYNIAEMFYANYDWPHANIGFWRYRNNLKENEKSPVDGRWRWLISDTDYGFAVEDSKTINSAAIETKANAVSLDMFYKVDKKEYVFKNLFNNEEFRKQFVIRYFDLLNTAFKTERVIEVIDEFANRIADEIPRHTARWGNQTGGMLENFQDWQENVNNLKNFARERPHYVEGHLIDYFNLAGVYQLTINAKGDCQGIIEINDLNLKNESFPWIGRYPINYQLRIEADSSNECQFLYWTSDNLLKDQQFENLLKIQPLADLSLTAHFMTMN